MHTIEEKRVYGDREGATEAYVASAVGVVRVRVAGDAVGEFGLVDRRDARDVAAGAGRVAVATDEDVLVAAGDRRTPAFEGTGFGPASAVGIDGDDLLAAAPDGAVARRRDGEWTRLAFADADERHGSRESGAPDAPAVRAIDGDLVATDRGVSRAREAELAPAGLEAVRDVAAAGPLAATADGLYELGNGWVRALAGSFDVVAAEPADDRPNADRTARAHAAAGATVYGRADGEWREVATAPGPVAGIAHGEAVYAVTSEGTFLARRDGEEWRSRALGVVDVRAIALPRPAR